MFNCKTSKKLLQRPDSAICDPARKELLCSVRPPIAVLSTQLQIRYILTCIFPQSYRSVIRAAEIPWLKQLLKAGIGASFISF
jgi:hypothetical protein